MHIIELRIRGFKTYRDETIISFHPGCNCIVGLNGSGKSNILAAIQFLLSGNFGTTLSEKRSLLHEGLGSPVSEVSVEILLDNVGRRLSMYDEDIVSIKRTFNNSCQREDWHICGKNVSRKDFDSILESCGISRNNPYFIVRQGKVTELATMSDISRLRLLKEIAGTRIYDERREESMRVLLETETRKMKVDSVFNDIQKRIETLKDEQKEFDAFLTLDRRRRALEYMITEFEWEDASRGEQDYFEKITQAREQLGVLEVNVRNIEARSQELYENKSKIEFELNELEIEKKTIQNMISHYSEMKVYFDVEKDTKKTKLKLSNLLKSENESKRRINELEFKVGELINQRDQLKSRYNSMLNKRDLLRYKESSLISKHVETKFSTVEERNRALKLKIDNYNIDKFKLEAHLTSIRKSMKDKNYELNTINDSVSKLKNDYSLHNQKFEFNFKEIQENLENKQNIFEKKHEINKLIHQKTSRLKLISSQITEFERIIDFQIKHSIRKGLTFAQKYCEDKNIPWGLNESHQSSDILVFGTILENIDVEEVYMVAVEVAAGNNLHNLIVRNKAIASEMLLFFKANNKSVHHKERYESNYSIVLTPIDDIKEFNLSTYKCDIKHEGAIPMINILNFDEALKVVIEQIFGNYYIVENLDIGRILVEKYGVNCVTLEGDEWNNKGCIRGGYRKFGIGRNSNVIVSYKAHKNLLRERNSLNYEILKFNEELIAIEDKINDLTSKREELLSEKEYLSSKILKTREMIHLSENNFRNLKSLISKISEEEEKTLVSLDAVQTYIAELEIESEHKFLSKGLTKEDEHYLKDIIEQLRTLEHSEIPKIEKELSEVTNNIEKQQVRLNTLYDDYYSIQEEKCEEDIKFKNGHDLDFESFFECDKILSESTEQLSDINNKIDSKIQEMSRINLNIETISQEEQKTLEQQKDLKNMFSILENKYNSYKSAKESILLEKTKKSTNVFSEIYIPKDRNKIYEELHDIKGRLSKEFKIINRKVIIELDQFIQEYTDLSDRHNELGSAMSSVQNLIEVLDLQKEKTLLKTFEEINFHFNQVFRELIPTGDAKLILKLSKGRGDENRSINQSVGNGNLNVNLTEKKNKMSKVYNLTDDNSLFGIGIKVTFNLGSANSQVNQQCSSNRKSILGGSYYSLNQLSGGQKTLVAIALLFAIHRADPAPFYLLDEVDAALDDQYRWSVANLIQKQSISTQFIVTTFRPQILEISNKFLQVSQINRSSFVKEISRQQALELQQEQNQQKAIATSSTD
ncbi:SMC type chromosomal ABC Atpase [Cryptosporidium ryanae]|uniref:SMC type chromosomal ABC Atpase n=1 Tax=Cryptosporidium ryanae TaxID=515981 RepID=UPI00351A7CE1|nr:SMC type chromosomal ABC Atpase [Cryptosporidium ryanae]